MDSLLAELSGKPVASRDYSLTVATGFTLQRLLLLPSTGSRVLGFVSLQHVDSVFATPGL